MTDFYERQRRKFNLLVGSGSYQGFQHSATAITFVETQLKKCMERIACKNGHLRILEGGCGPGYWLLTGAEIARSRGFNEIELYGFDLSDEMISLARSNLRKVPHQSYLHVGNLMEVNSYEFESAEEFELIIVYDVIQQLPFHLHRAAVRTLLQRVASGGCLCIFDHDLLSSYGVRMSIKKFITKYFGIPLLPREYCDAVYPDVSAIKRMVRKNPKVERLALDRCIALNKVAMTIEVA